MPYHCCLVDVVSFYLVKSIKYETYGQRQIYYEVCISDNNHSYMSSYEGIMYQCQCMTDPGHLAPVHHNNSPSSQSIVIEWRLGWAEIIWGHGGTSCPCPPTFISGVLYTSSLSRYYRMFCLICIYIIVSIYLLIRSCYAGGNHVVNASTISTTNIKSH